MHKCLLEVSNCAIFKYHDMYLVGDMFITIVKTTYVSRLSCIDADI